MGAEASKPDQPKEVTEERMSRRRFVEKSAEGRPQFVTVKRSRSYKDQSRYDREYYKVSVEEWNCLVERERTLAEQNITLSAENKTLKVGLAGVEADNLRLTGTTIPQLKSQISMLAADNEALQRTLDKAGGTTSRGYHEVERLHKKVDRLERENKILRAEDQDLRCRVKELKRDLDGSYSCRVEELKREVNRWKDQCRGWKKAYDLLLAQHDSVQGLLIIKVEKIKVYEEMLRRNRILV